MGTAVLFKNEAITQYTALTKCGQSSQRKIESKIDIVLIIRANNSNVTSVTHWERIRWF